MVPVAHGGLRHLRYQRLRIAQRQMLQMTAQREFPLQNTRPDPIAFARALHDRPAGSAFASHEQRNAHQPFVAGNRDFRRCAAFHHVEQ